ncbi:HAMP domain-containing protein [Ruminiclostridium sufflavum DSM 19573]|uniref:histidine kinase n=1 Tax=Ruminiclostridium sufflavum DSM 19573 TaxID=1121337 RepID=A0A318XIM1_9FIRM|nr:ATP-binding protein [Ruminiclostridium sufflavum]PYG84305.1 HAMP domain-containing protein [Ruminiclostridium sufflavum DSM 19573]
MKYSLRTRLSLSYIFVALISIFLISIFANLFLDRQFREYIKINQVQRNKDVISSLSNQYQYSGSWNTEMIEAIGVSALENGLIIKVSDLSGQAIWDARVHNNGMCQRIIEHMSYNLNSQYPNMKGEYTETPYNIYYNSQKVGIVEIGSYGPFYLSDNDLAFLKTLNKILISVGIIALIFSLALGTVMAKRLSSPISKAISAAHSISEGCFSARISEKSNTIEIIELTNTINSLADALGNHETLRKRLTADVAHELRTPLATLQSHLEAMIDGIWEADKDRLISCHDEIVRLSGMVGDLEKLARYESENIILNKSSFSITEVVRQIIRNYESEYLYKGIKIYFTGDEEFINADKDKISQVLINLLSNALKYSTKGSEVKVNIKGGGNLLQLTVKDNGPGISAEDLPFIFERFYRADKSRNRMTGGSGIGLTIARAIIEAHNGKIEAVSKRGAGTEFIVSLPKN